MSTARVYATDLTDAQWALLERALPERHGPGRPREVDLRQIFNGLRSLNRTGCQGRRLPKEFGYWGTGRSSFDKWTQDGTLEHLNTTLREQVRRRAGRDPQPSAAVLDRQTAKSTAIGGERGFDGGKTSGRAQAARAGGHAGAAAGRAGRGRGRV